MTSDNFSFESADTDTPPNSKAFESETASAARERIGATIGNGSDEKTRQRAASGRTTPPGSRQTKIGKSLSRMYGSLGMTIYPFDNVCGGTILENADAMADALEQLANENAAVKRVIERLVETSAWGIVATAHAPVIMSVFMHHGGGVTNKVSGKMNGQRDSKTGHDDVTMNTEGGGYDSWNVVPEYQPPTTV